MSDHRTTPTQTQGAARAEQRTPAPQPRSEPSAAASARFANLMRREPGQALFERKGEPPAQGEEARHPSGATEIDLYASDVDGDEDQARNPFDTDTPTYGSMIPDGSARPMLDGGVPTQDWLPPPPSSQDTLERLTNGLVSAFQMSRKTVANKWNVRLVLEQSFLKDTALELARDGGGLKVRIVTSSMDSFRLMAPHVSELRERLEARCEGFAEVDIKFVSGPIGGPSTV